MDKEITSPDIAVGTRIFCIYGADNDQVMLIGHGRYDGMFPVEDWAAGEIAEYCRKTGEPNPRFTLDSGEQVYGCECWWMKDRLYDVFVDGRKVINVSIQQLRAENAQKG